MASEEDPSRAVAGDEGSSAQEESPSSPREGAMGRSTLSPQHAGRRLGSPQSDGAPRKRYRKGTYRGVRERSSGKWIAEIKDTASGIRKWLGTYTSAEAAALAFDEALREIKGASAQTNFPPGAYLASTDPPRVLVPSERGREGREVRYRPPSMTVSAPASTSASGTGAGRYTQSSPALSLSPSPSAASACSGEGVTASVAHSTRSQWGASGSARPAPVERHKSPVDECSAPLTSARDPHLGPVPDARTDMRRQGGGHDAPPRQVAANAKPPQSSRHHDSAEGAGDMRGSSGDRAHLFQLRPLDTGQLEVEGVEEGDISIDEIERILMG